jgi:predicted transcriptional regulator
VLHERKRAKTSFYDPRVTREEAQRSAVRSLLDKAFDGAFGSLLQHLVVDKELPERDRAALVSMLDRLEEEEANER